MTQSHRFSLALLALSLCLGATQTRAELPPSAYAEMKAGATEVVEIEVTRVSRNQREREGLRDISVYADAKVTRVTRSKSRLKVGDKISLRYMTFEIVQRGWVGPSAALTVEKGKRYRAWLRKGGAHFYAAAKGRSLEEK